MDKFKEEILQDFGKKLYERRLEVYPELYFYLSEFIKIVDFDEITKPKISELFAQIEKWDSKNSIYFSYRTSSKAYRLR